MTDRSTGVSFALPGKATVQRRPAGQTSYQSELGGGLGVSVGFVAANADLRPTDLVSYSERLKSQFVAIGATDAMIVGLTPLTYQGHPAIQFRFSFTALSPDHPKSVWLIRAIADGDVFVVVQTVGFSVRPDTMLPAATAIEQRAASSVQLV